jgi:hypothetical protein
MLVGSRRRGWYRGDAGQPFHWAGRKRVVWGSFAPAMVLDSLAAIGLIFCWGWPLSYICS